MDFQLFGGSLLPDSSYRGGRQMYQSRFALDLLERDSVNHSCCITEGRYERADTLRERVRYRTGRTSSDVWFATRSILCIE